MDSASLRKSSSSNDETNRKAFNHRSCGVNPASIETEEREAPSLAPERRGSPRADCEPINGPEFNLGGFRNVAEKMPMDFEYAPPTDVAEPLANN